MKIAVSMIMLKFYINLIIALGTERFKNSQVLFNNQTDSNNFPLLNLFIQK